MRKNRFRRKMIYYAKILIAIGIVLLAYGLIMNYVGEYKLIDPVKDVIKEEDDSSTIHVDTSDGTVIKEEDIKDDKSKDSDKTKNNPVTGNNNSNNNNNNSGGGSVTPAPAQPEPTPTPQPHIPTIDEVNNSIRNQIQNDYGITVLYGSETSNYRIGSIGTNSITDSTLINSQLNRLKSALSLYPKGLFSEMRSGGIPLTVLLINNFSEPGVTGITDSNYSYANISIAAAYPFEESFYHESYHYIERYLYKYGASFGGSWTSLNPPGSYSGTINSSLSYDSTFLPSAPFVNDYAQTSAEEDRASTFEYMMAGSKASCLNAGNTVWKKAKVISDTIDIVLNSVSPYSTEYWERYL